MPQSFGLALQASCLEFDSTGGVLADLHDPTGLPGAQRVGSRVTLLVVSALNARSSVCLAVHALQSEPRWPDLLDAIHNLRRSSKYRRRRGKNEIVSRFLLAEISSKSSIPPTWPPTRVVSGTQIAHVV